MKWPSICVLALASFSSFASCPDFTGVYLQGPGSCSGNLADMHPWPLIEQKEITRVLVTQLGCEQIIFEYAETQYSNRPVRIEKVDLNSATKLKIGSDGSLVANFVDPIKRLDTMLGVSHLAVREQLKLKQLDHGVLSLKTKSFMTGSHHYVIPVLDLDTTRCELVPEMT